MISNISYALSASSLLIIYLISLGLTDDLSPSTYVLNTYLYIFLSVLMIGTTWTSIDKYNFGSYVVNNYFSLVCLSFVSLLTTLFTTNEQYLMKHISWATFIMSIGATSYITYKINLSSGMLYKVLITLILTMGLLSYFAYFEPFYISKNWHIVLLYILSIMIIMEVIDFTTSSSKSTDFINRSKIYGWILVSLFSGFVIYDTQKILNDGITKSYVCGKSQYKCADYPKASLGLFLDAINLFISTTRIIY